MKKFAVHLPDALAVAGVGSISYGAGLLHVAAGFMVAGGLLLALAYLAARKEPA